VSRFRERGAVLVETALMISTALTLILFTVDVGVLGLAQVQADAASFIDAHQNVIGNVNPLNGTPEQFTAGLFPLVKQSDMSTTVIPAPTPSVQVDYGYNPPGGGTPAPGSASNRVGGASMMQPVQLQVTVSPSPLFNIMGHPVGVQAQYQEPKWTECGPHYNVENENFACGDPAAPPDSAVAPSDAENTPPYYVGYNLMTHCVDSEPWGDPANATWSSACSETNFISLGVSTYLDTDNWKITTNGVSGTTGSSVFEAAAFHQRVYANIAQFLAKYPTLFPLYYDYSNQIYKQLKVSSFTTKPPTPGFYDNTTWSAFAVSNTSDPSKADPNGIDEAIQCVYNWDETINSGFAPGTYKEPGDDPLHPDQPCVPAVTL